MGLRRGPANAAESATAYMLFNSLEFFAFFVLVYGLYLVLPHRAQNRMLLVASYTFYGSWDWRFLSLIAVSTIVDYFAGLRIEAETAPRQRRRWLQLSLAANLGLLGAFKYFDFFVASAEATLAGLGVEAPGLLRLDVVLPVGISFYTFQTMSYTLDIYRGTLRPTRNFLDFALFISIGENPGIALRVNMDWTIPSWMGNAPGAGPGSTIPNGALQFMLYEECKARLGLHLQRGSHRGSAAGPDTTARRDHRDSNRAHAGASASGSASAAASAASTGAPRRHSRRSWTRASAAWSFSG